MQPEGIPADETAHVNRQGSAFAGQQLFLPKSIGGRRREVAQQDQGNQAIVSEYSGSIDLEGKLIAGQAEERDGCRAYLQGIARLGGCFDAEVAVGDVKKDVVGSFYPDAGSAGYGIWHRHEGRAIVGGIDQQGVRIGLPAIYG